MARSSLRDRFFTRRVARAMTSPSAILLAATGASAAILAGALPLAVPAALVAWAARVAAALPRPTPGPQIDPDALDEPWSRFVREAVAARSRMAEAVRSTSAGPLQERVAEIADRLQTGVDEVWRIACRGQALSQARTSLDEDAIRRELAEIADDTYDAWSEGSALDRAADSLRAQLASVERLDRAIADLYARLRLLDARLDEAVVRTVELSVQAETSDDLGDLGSDVDGLVTEMEALRQALEDMGGSAAPGQS